MADRGNRTQCRYTIADRRDLHADRQRVGQFPADVVIEHHMPAECVDVAFGPLQQAAQEMCTRARCLERASTPTAWVRRSRSAQFFTEWFAAIKPSIDATTWQNWWDYAAACVIPEIGEGAFQMTGATFGAYHEPGTLSNNRDLVAQAAAFINDVQGRYDVADDGSNLAALVQQADPTRLDGGEIARATAVPARAFGRSLGGAMCGPLQRQNGGRLAALPGQVLCKGSRRWRPRSAPIWPHR